MFAFDARDARGKCMPSRVAHASVLALAAPWLAWRPCNVQDDRGSWGRPEEDIVVDVVGTEVGVVEKETPLHETAVTCESMSAEMGDEVLGGAHQTPEPIDVESDAADRDQQVEPPIEHAEGIS